MKRQSKFVGSKKRTWFARLSSILTIAPHKRI